MTALALAALPERTDLPAPPVLSLRKQLATNIFFVAHGSKGSVLWTGYDYRTLCHRMLMGNSEHDFLMCYRDKQGNAKFSKARTAKASRRIDWAFDSMCENGSGNKTGIGFYPSNADHETCWGAMDFDAHGQGERLRARSLAGKAFELLHANPDLWLILGTSGQSGGWHLFIFTEDFFPTDEWARLLREVADKVGVPIRKGLLEIFPDGRTRGLGCGIRAPASWNPKDDSFGLIYNDGAMPKLRELRALGSPKRNNIALYARGTTREGEFSSPSSKFFRGEQNEWGDQFAITEPRSRHDQMTKLAGVIFFQTAKEIARENVRLQYADATPAPRSTLDEHLSEFEKLWQNLLRDWRTNLSPREREKFDILSTANERDAFRIIRNWSKADCNSSDFKIVCESLARRLGLSLRGASKMRIRFCSLGILRQTAPYVPRKLAARFCWSADEPSGVTE